MRRQPQGRQSKSKARIEAYEQVRLLRSLTLHASHMSHPILPIYQRGPFFLKSSPHGRRAGPRRPPLSRLMRPSHAWVQLSHCLSRPSDPCPPPRPLLHSPPPPHHHHHRNPRNPSPRNTRNPSRRNTRHASPRNARATPSPLPPKAPRSYALRMSRWTSPEVPCSSTSHTTSSAASGWVLWATMARERPPVSMHSRASYHSRAELYIEARRW